MRAGPGGKTGCGLVVVLVALFEPNRGAPRWERGVGSGASESPLQLRMITPLFDSTPGYPTAKTRNLPHLGEMDQKVAAATHAGSESAGAGGNAPAPRRGSGPRRGRSSRSARAAGGSGARRVVARPAETRARPAARNGRQRNFALMRAGRGAPPDTADRPRRSASASGRGSDPAAPDPPELDGTTRAGHGARSAREARRAVALRPGPPLRPPLRVSHSEEIANTGPPGGDPRGLPESSRRRARPPRRKAVSWSPSGGEHL